MNWQLFSQAVVEPCTMNATFSLLLAFLVQLFLPRHNAQLRLLKAQIRILRSRIPLERLILSRIGTCGGG